MTQRNLEILRIVKSSLEDINEALKQATKLLKEVTESESAQDTEISSESD